MSKTMKNSLTIIGIVAVLFVIVWLVYDVVKTEPVDANIVYDNLVDENTGLDNIINELYEDISNEIETNTVNKEENKNETEEENGEDVSTSETITSKQEKAIALVKKEWGGEDGVYFLNDSVDSQGRYIVSVRNSKTTNVIVFFVVDVENELVTKK